MQPHPKNKEISQTWRIKYNIWYPIYPGNQGPTINNNINVHSYFYWWNCYLLVIQQSLPQWGSHHSLFGLTESLTNDKKKSGYWYEVAGENPQWSSTDFITMLLLNFSHSPKRLRANSSTQTLNYYRFRACTHSACLARIDTRQPVLVRSGTRHAC